MSYNPERNEDSLSEYFSSLVDFDLISKQLKEHLTDNEFHMWFLKAKTIDPRSTIIFVRENANKMSHSNRLIALSFLKKFEKEGQENDIEYYIS